MEEYTVYKHTSPSGKVYIGITKRKAEYRWLNGNGYKNHQHFYNAIQKYGWENITHEILFTGLTKQQAEEEEKRLICEYNATNRRYGYNKTYGGEFGAKHTSETKEKISKKLIAYFSNEEHRKAASERMLGKKPPEKTRQKMSESHKSMMTDEYRKKLSEAKTGKKIPNFKSHKQTEETKRKISESKKGKHYGGKGRNPRPVLCVETGIVYKNAMTAQNETGTGFGNIYRVCNQGYGTANGYHWKYAV